MCKGGWVFIILAIIDCFVHFLPQPLPLLACSNCCGCPGIVATGGDELEVLEGATERGGGEPCIACSCGCCAFRFGSIFTIANIVIAILVFTRGECVCHTNNRGERMFSSYSFPLSLPPPPPPFLPLSRFLVLQVLSLSRKPACTLATKGCTTMVSVASRGWWAHRLSSALSSHRNLSGTLFGFLIRCARWCVRERERERERELFAFSFLRLVLVLCLYTDYCRIVHNTW